MDEERSQTGLLDHLRDSRSRAWFWCHNVILDMGLSVYEIAVYCALARHADGSGEKRICFPSYSRLSRILGCSRPRAVQAVQILIQKGLLRKTPRKDGFGHHSNLYELVDPISTGKENGPSRNRSMVPLVNEGNQVDQNLTPRFTRLTTPVNQENHPGQPGLPGTRTSEQEKRRKPSSNDEDPYAQLYIKGKRDD